MNNVIEYNIEYNIMFLEIRELQEPNKIRELQEPNKTHKHLSGQSL